MWGLNVSTNSSGTPSADIVSSPYTLLFNLLLLHKANNIALDFLSHLRAFLHLFLIILKDKKERFRGYKCFLLASAVLFPLYTLPVLLLCAVLEVEAKPYLGTPLMLPSSMDPPRQPDNIVVARPDYLKDSVESFLY